MSDRNSDSLEYETPRRRPAHVRRVVAATTIVAGVMWVAAAVVGCFFLSIVIIGAVKTIAHHWDWGWRRFTRSDEFEPLIFGLLIATTCLVAGIRWYRYWRRWR